MINTANDYEPLLELASNGEEALSIWKAGRFNVVLTDVNMPKLNGYELAGEPGQRPSMSI